MNPIINTEKGRGFDSEAFRFQVPKPVKFVCSQLFLKFPLHW